MSARVDKIADVLSEFEGKRYFCRRPEFPDQTEPQTAATTTSWALTATHCKSRFSC